MRLVFPALFLNLLPILVRAQDYYPPKDLNGYCYVDGFPTPCTGEKLYDEEVSWKDCVCSTRGGSFSYIGEDGTAICAPMEYEDTPDQKDRALSEVESGEVASVSGKRRKLQGFWFWIRIFLESPFGTPHFSPDYREGGYYTCRRPLIARRGLGASRSLQLSNSFPEGCEQRIVCDAGIVGEPHIKQLIGGWYDYHGECDLVFTHAPSFGDGIGLDIHVRTKIRYDYSFIESAAIRIGNDILEIAGFGQYNFNGVSRVDLTSTDATLSGYPVAYRELSDIQHSFAIKIGSKNMLVIDTMKEIVSIKFQGIFGPEMHSWFGNSSGLMGSLSTSQKIGRDGVTVIEDLNAMGQEWQVRDSEPKLFVNQDRPPQYPSMCTLPLPSATESRRRLGESVSREEAETACENWSEDEKELCVYDVIATGDKELAKAGAY